MPTEKIHLYIAPFALQCPFELTLDVSILTNDSTASTVSARVGPTEQLNNVLKALQDIWNHDLPSSPQRESFPEQGKWIIFCATRLTFISRATIADCNWWDLVVRRTSRVGAYAVIPSSLALAPDFVARMRELSPTALPYGTPDEARTADQRCSQCELSYWSCVNKAHFSKQLFHMQGTHRISDLVVSGRSYLVIWVPGIALPWEMPLPSNAGTDPTTCITGLLRWALKEFFLGSTSSKIVTNLVALGYYPTPSNWMLIDFKSAMQIHSSSVPALRVPERKSLAYIVGSLQCGTLAKQMVDVLQEQGALGWPKFWEGIVAAKLPSRESGGDGGEMPE